MSSQALYVVIAAMAGAAVPILASANAAFGQAIGSVYLASMVLCVVAFLCIGATMLALGTPLPTMDALTAVPLWQLGAGVFFTIYIVSMTFVAPRIGLGNAIFIVVVAQICTAVVIDHFGLLGAERHPVDVKRGLGLALLISGLALARSTPPTVAATG